MNKIKHFFSNRKGLYKIAFTCCALILSLFVVAITDNKTSVDAPVTVKEKIVNTNNISSDDISKALNGIKKNPENEIHQTKVPETTEEKNFEDATFSKPVFGKVIKPFSIDTPIYSKTMDDWRIHEGVDIACMHGAEIYSSQDGTVTDIGYDINFGNYIIIKSGEYELKYTSLASDINFAIGDNVSKGQLLGVVSDSCVSEICDEPHFHFEIKKGGQAVDPEKLIMFE